MAKTNYAAFQQLRPLQGDVSQDMQYWNEDAAHRRRENQQQEEFNWRQKQAEIAQKEQEKRRRIADYEKYAKPYVLKDTGNRSLNTVQAEYLINAREKIKELIPQLDEAKNKGDYKSEFAIISKLEELNKAPEKFMSIVSSGVNFWKQIDEDFSKGLINEEQYKTEKEKYQNYFNNMRVGIDDDLNPLVFYMDDNKNGINDLEELSTPIESKTFQDILTGEAFPKFYSSHSVEGLAKKYAEAYETQKKVTDNGYKKTTETVLPLEAIKNAARRDLVDNQGNYTSVAKGIAYRLGYDPENITTDQLESMVTSIVEESKPMYKTVDEENVRTSSGNSTPNAKPNFTVNTPSKEIYGGFMDNIDTSTTNSVSVSNFGTEKGKYDFKDANTGNIITGGIPNSYTVDKNNQVLVDVSYLEDKGGKIQSSDEMNADETVSKAPVNKRTTIRIPNEDVGNFATYLGITKQELLAKAKKESTKEKPTFPEWKKSNPNGTWADYSKL